ncbi:PREDICTED: phosphate-regulating neutral endopeptidase-like, partial [Wasmannia auropunctata]|uniref:phosphate-regulating neutral endopeptidase-like n=1 Tax=Wasmannia auropunctata TaxID=64793 RepID=UPI0005EF8E6E
MMTNIINETVIANNNVILIVSIFYDLLTCIKCNAIFRTDILSSIVEASNSLETSNNVILKETKCDDICLSPECIHIASQVLKNMNPKVEPCDDFYKFACGGFLESTFIPDDQNTVNTISTINDNIQKQRRLILEQDSPPNELRPFKLAKDFYKSCINKTAIEQRGLTLLLNNLKELGGWPVLDSEGSWNENDFTWMDSVYRFRRFGHSFCYFIGFKVMNSYNSTENYSKRWISLFRASFGLSRKYLINGLDDKFVQAYYDYMVDIAVILGAKLSQARTELKESLKFEIKLANISFDEKPSPNNSMTLNQLSAAYPSIPWQEYFNTILAPQGQLNQNDTISVHHPGYLKNFILLISTTPKRVQANYAFWRAIAATIKYYETDDIWKIRLKYLSNLKLNGKQNRQPRWKECIDIVSEGKKLLYISVESMYVRKYFKEDAKKIVLEMANDVKQEFTMILKKADWINEETKSYILEKTAVTTLNIAYPDELLNDRKLEEFYEKLELNADDYIGNIFNLSNFETNLEFSKLRQPWNKTEWIKRVKPAAANAFYLWLENEIEVNVGIMQGIFFNDERPHYMNY